MRFYWWSKLNDLRTIKMMIHNAPHAKSPHPNRRTGTARLRMTQAQQQSDALAGAKDCISPALQTKWSLFVHRAIRRAAPG